MSNQPIIKKIVIRNVRFGENVMVVEPSNIYECVIGDNCFIGPFCEIQKGAKIGARTKVQSHSFICTLVSIGEDCFVGHGVMFINDDFSSGGPSGGDSAKWRKTIIGNNVSIGTGVTILPVQICDNVVIGAGSVVVKNIDVPGVYAGNPARMIRRFEDKAAQNEEKKEEGDGGRWV